MEKYEKTLSEYEKLDCDQLKSRFEKDIENNEIKYFSGGFAGTGNLTKNLKKYNIQNFDQGCVVRMNLFCYSELVAEYLKEKENIDIGNLY